MDSYDYAEPKVYVSKMKKMKTCESGSSLNEILFLHIK